MDNEDFEIYGASDIGKKRSENQDHFMVANLRRQLIVRQTDIPQSEHEQLYGCQEGNLLVVADGMGGHHGGEMASRIAVEESARYVLDMVHWFLKLSPKDEQDFQDELSDCLRSVQQKIWREDAGGHRSMGTTVTMAYLLWPRMFIVHAGDSRCYLLRAGELRQLTTDHTIAQQMVDSGGMSSDDAALSNWRHVLWNCVGGGEKHVRPEAIRCRLQRGDVVLLCSDGLTGMVSDSEIKRVIRSMFDAKQATQSLIDTANKAGGADNISVVICKVNEPRDCDNQGLDSTIG